jgi:Ser/Thr protein kinase RdoA (MazF antagonist)
MDLDRLRLPSAELNGDSRVESSGKVWRFFHNKEQLGDLGDPVAWATGKGAVLTYPTQCPTHGDMHVRNIYVLADDSPRLIDFGRTAMGHVWRDFAALEVSLRLTCICTTDLRKLKRVEDILCRAGGLSRYLDFRVFENEEDRELSELIRTVMKIRREAHDAAGQVGQDLEKQYFFAVMMHMLRYANGDADEVAGNKVKERRLVRMWHAHYGAAKAAEAAESILNP